VLLFTDARQQIEPGALRLLIENFATPTWERPAAN